MNELQNRAGARGEEQADPNPSRINDSANGVQPRQAPVFNRGNRFIVEEFLVLNPGSQEFRLPGEIVIGRGWKMSPKRDVTITTVVL